MNLLVEDAPQTCRVQSESVRLGSYVRRQMKRGIRVKVLVAIETGDPEALIRALSVFRLVEFLLGKGGEKQSKALNLYGRKNADHQRVVVLDRQQLAAGYIAE